jgi:hypothetical protein
VLAHIRGNDVDTIGGNLSVNQLIFSVDWARSIFGTDVQKTFPSLLKSSNFNESGFIQIFEIASCDFAVAILFFTSS